jgi:hypothetical protein
MARTRNHALAHAYFSQLRAATINGYDWSAVREINNNFPAYVYALRRHGTNRHYYAARKVLTRRSDRQRAKHEFRSDLLEMQDDQP